MEGSGHGDSTRESAQSAFDAIDRVLADAPQSVQPICLALTHSLVRLRDALIAEQRANRAVSAQLMHTNALLSLVFSIQYPLEGVHSEKLKQARDTLARVIAEAAGD
jgi:hypothetical protein